jgi:hypothetical protein
MDQPVKKEEEENRPEYFTSVYTYKQLKNELESIDIRNKTYLTLHNEMVKKTNQEIDKTLNQMKMIYWFIFVCLFLLIVINIHRLYFS